jgi:type IV secretory pathway VirB2 component (pilin)
MQMIKKINDSISNLEAKINASKRVKFTLSLTVLALLMFVFISEKVNAFTINTTGGTFADFYNTIMGFIFGDIGIIIAVFMLLFGIIMMVAKHWMVGIISFIAIVLFFLAPEIVLGVASTGAGLAGAII